MPRLALHWQILIGMILGAAIGLSLNGLLGDRQIEVSEGLPDGVTNPQGPVRNLPEGLHVSWIGHLLPHLGEPARARQLDLSLGAYHTKNDRMRQLGIPLLRCPSYPGPDGPHSNYAGVHHDVEAPIDADNHGLLFLNSRLPWEDLVDGPTHPARATVKTEFDGKTMVITLENFDYLRQGG